MHMPEYRYANPILIPPGGLRGRCAALTGHRRTMMHRRSMLFARPCRRWRPPPCSGFAQPAAARVHHRDHRPGGACRRCASKPSRRRRRRRWCGGGLPGHWGYANSNWNWVPGQYAAPPRQQAVWDPGHWAQQPAGSEAMSGWKVASARIRRLTWRAVPERRSPPIGLTASPERERNPVPPPGCASPCCEATPTADAPSTSPTATTITA